MHTLTYVCTKQIKVKTYSEEPLHTVYLGLDSRWHPREAGARSDDPDPGAGAQARQ